MQRPDPIRAVVFDFDGLLADTERAWELAQAAMFTSRGLVIGDTDRDLFLGTAVADTATIMAARFNEPQPDVLADLTQRAKDELHRNAPAMPGAAELLAGLRGRLPFAVASNTPRELLDIALHGSGLAPLIEVVVSADQVPNPKPAPDVYLQACALLGVEVSEAIAVEDSRPGTAAARAAGLWVAMIPSGASEPSDAHAFVHSLRDPELLGWLA
ncbi:HAD family hydrolase [Micropruina sp.]|uniref:HAD family hydrolase n=1 Tax=Micropruina sp. TaxID=2737536 RepID=UPI0039E642E4